MKTKGSYFQAQFQRLRARRGPKKAIIAVAASMLTAVYYILRDGVPYQELGSEHFTCRNQGAHREATPKRLEDLGFTVEVRPATAGVLSIYLGRRWPARRAVRQLVLDEVASAAATTCAAAASAAST